MHFPTVEFTNLQNYSPWVVFPAALLASWVIGWLASRLTQLLLGGLTSRTKTPWDDTLVDRLGGPIALLWTALAMHICFSAMGLTGPLATLLHRAPRTVGLLGIFWSLWRVSDVAGQFVSASVWAQARAASRSLVPLIVRATKVAILALSAVAVLSELGYPVASLLAGLGLGGLALALAAQKTVENLFGAFALGLDQPFREGDFVKVDDVTGTVESIGLRSTRIRTLQRTLVSIPNGKLADSRVESFAARDRICFQARLDLLYSTTSDQARRVLKEIEQLLRNHPRTWKDVVQVHLVELAPSSIKLELLAWLETADWGEFKTLQQELLLDIMRLVRAAGTDFAFPTRTVQLSQGSPTGGRP